MKTWGDPLPGHWPPGRLVGPFWAWEWMIALAVWAAVTAALAGEVLRLHGELAEARRELEERPWVYVTEEVPRRVDLAEAFGVVCYRATGWELARAQEEGDSSVP